MKKIKKLLLAFIMTLTLSTLKINASIPIGISVWLSNMYSQPKTGYHTKMTLSAQTFQPQYITNDRSGYVALLNKDGKVVDQRWHGFNRIDDDTWDIEKFDESTKDGVDYALKFKTTGFYFGGTGITGFWYIDL
jgi:hypothetical protein